MSVTQLRGHLLTKADLGDGYDLAPPRAAHHDDVTIQGCPALDQLGVDPPGSSLDFHRKVTASFTYGSAPSSTISEELYSDRPAKLATGTKKAFDAFVSCPQFTLIVGTRSIPVMTDKTTAPRLGDEGWAQFVVYNADSGASTTQKQVAVRSGSVVIMLSGAPGLVDSHIEAAVDKARHPD
ncbi:hypothetical protein [Streptomyces decoyicus]|uniref:hypothetical protein n=1 Tax=Streptomyces decoyicus TaxID=249567 RepID=UPI00386ADEFF